MESSPSSYRMRLKTEGRREYTMSPRRGPRLPVSRRRSTQRIRWLAALLSAWVVACAGDDVPARDLAETRRNALTILNSPPEVADTVTLDLDHFGPWSNRVPIEVPPFRGVEPALALAYSSAAPNGIVGHGWRLTGLSMIAAKSATMGIAEGIASDRYFLDGAELIPCASLKPSTPSCLAGGDYAFLDETFLRVKRTDSGWSIWNPNGTETRYIPTGDGRWAQGEIVDCHGQHVAYSYTAISGALYPASIEYGFDTQQVARFLINFHYEIRPDLLSKASASGLYETRQRLASISIHSDGQLVRAYNLRYDDVRTDTAGSFLQSVQQVGTDGLQQPDLRFAGSSLPAVEFFRASPLVGGFQEGAQGSVTVPIATLQASAAFGYSLDTALATLPTHASVTLNSSSSNRDGSPDFTAVVRPASVATGSLELLSALGPHRLPPQQGAIPVTRTPTNLAKDAVVFRPDIDGDGLSDLVAVRAREVTIARGKPDGTLTTMATTFISLLHDKGNRFLVGDFDGDGRTDIVAYSRAPSAMRQTPGSSLPCQTTLQPWSCTIEDESLVLLRFPPTGGVLASEIRSTFSSPGVDRYTSLPVPLPLVGGASYGDTALPLPEWVSADLDGDRVPELITLEAVPDTASGATSVTLRVTPHAVIETPTGEIRLTAPGSNIALAQPLEILNYQLIHATLDAYGVATFADPADLTARLVWGELNGDGRTDLLVQGFSGSELVLSPYHGRGDGSLEARQQINTGLSVVLIDSWRAGIKQIAEHGSPTECQYAECCDAAQDPDECRATYSAFADGFSLLQADLNGDGVDDLFAADEVGGRCLSAAGSCSFGVDWTSGEAEVSTQALILNRDGIVETRSNVWESSQPLIGKYRWWRQGNDNFVDTLHGWLIADYDGDGVSDVGWADFSGTGNTHIRVFPQASAVDNLTGIRFVDISGEGIPDMVRIDPLRGEIRSAVRTSSATTQVTATVPSGRVDELVSGDFGSIGDSRADGRTDFAWVSASGNFPGSAPQLTIAYSRGDGQFDLEMATVTGPADYVSARWVTADLDGDNTDEIVQVLSEGAATTIRALQRTGSLAWVGTATSTGLADGALGAGRWQTARLSGGERTEFVRVTVGQGGNPAGLTVDRLVQTTAGWSSQTQLVSLSLLDTLGPDSPKTLYRGHFHPSEANGDGVTDLVRVSRDRTRTSSRLAITQLTGSGLPAPSAYALSGFRVDAAGAGAFDAELAGAAWMPGDLDNDGFEDFAQVARGVGSDSLYNFIHVLHRTGVRSGRWERFRMAALGGNASDDTGAWGLVDWVGTNGAQGPDARLDLIRPFGQRTSGQPPDGTVGLAVYGADMAPPAVVKEVTGYGVTTELTYVSSKGRHNGLPAGMSETNVASLRRQVEPTGNYSYLAYTYDDFRYDHASKRTLSYRTATAQSSQHVTPGVRLTIENEQHPACVGRRSHEVFGLQSGGPLTETWLTYEKSNVNGNHVCIVQQERTTRFEYGGTPLTTRKRFQRDAYGNVNAVWDDGKFVDWNADGDDDETSDNRHTEITFVWNTSDFLIAFPSNTVRYGHLGQVIGQERFSYDGQTFGAAPIVGNATKKEEWDDLAGSWLTTTVSYWPNGAPRRTEGPTGVWQETTYDPDLELFPEALCNAVYCTRQTWNVRLGKLERNEDPNGEVTSYQYDVFGRLTRTVFNDGACLMHTWGDLGNPKKQFSFEGVCTQPNEEADPGRSLGIVTYFDGMMRPYRQVRQGTYERLLTHWGTTTLIRSGETWHPIGGQGAQSETYYEYMGRPVRVVNPDGSERRIGYWPAHIAAEDENGNMRELFRDARGNLLVSREWHFDQGWTPVETQNEYDDADRLTRAVDPLGAVTSAEFSSLGWKTRTCDPDQGCTGFTYFSDGRLESSTDNRQMRVDYAYDGLGRLVSRATVRNGVAVELERIWWDNDPLTGQPSGFSIGRVARRRDEAGESAFTYDIRGRVARQQRVTTALGYLAFAEWEMGFDLAGRLSFIQYPDKTGVLSPNSELVEYQYDALGRTERLDSQLAVYLSSASYDPDDRLEVAAFGNGVVERAFYDPQRKWLEGIEVIPTFGDGLVLGYSYDRAGRPLTHTWSDPVFHQLDFEYDTLDRLRTVSGELTQEFAYDAAGRMAYNSAAGGSYVYGSNPSHGVVRAGATSLTYDASGHAETIDGASYEWDEDGRLVRGSTPTGNVAWGYAPDGSRVSKVVGNSPTFYFGGLVEQDANGFKYLYKLGGRVIAERTGGTVEWLHRDLASSTRAISDASGTIGRRFDYEPYGKQYQATGSRPTLGYRAEHFDEETGLVLLGARYYHPGIARFISADSIIPELENTQAHDRYAYAYNSPVGLIDPSGHAPRAANAVDTEETRKKDKDPKVERPLPEYCRDHPEDKRCNDPAGGPQPIYVKAVDPALAANAIHNRQTQEAQDEQEDWNAQAALNDVGTRFWNLVNSGTWTEQVVLEVGEDTGFNALTRAGTGEDILSNELSLEERVDNFVEGTVKVAETTATVATVVELGTELLAKKGIQAAAGTVDNAVASDAVLSGGCFARGTPVLTTSGLQPIESIRAGDWVYAYNVERATVTWRQVVTATVRESPTIQLAFRARSGAAATSTVRATVSHPFLLCDSRWVEAALLRPGDCLITATGTATLIALGSADRLESVFNFEVEGDHDYFVGELSLVVHNISSISRPPVKVTNAPKAPVGSTRHVKLDKANNGAYKIDFESGRQYAGKGGTKRARTSGRERSRGNDDPVDSITHYPANSNAEAFKKEAELLDEIGGPGGNTYNRINSPGKGLK